MKVDYREWEGLIMRWSNCAVDDLKKYKRLKQSLQNIEERIEVLEMQFTGIKGSKTDKIPAHGGGTKWEDFMLDNIVERERLKMLKEANEKIVKIIERGLDSLDKTERLILDSFFVSKKHDHVEMLKDKLNLEKSQVYKLKNQALYKFTVSMYGIEEY